MIVLYPTNHCFDDALDFISNRLKEDRRTAGHLILVHGIMLSPADHDPPNEPYAHAWVEDGITVWDAGILEGQGRVWYSVSRNEYYKNLRPQKMSRYNVSMAMRLNALHNNFGPWRKEYQELCGKGILGTPIHHAGIDEFVTGFLPVPEEK